MSRAGGLDRVLHRWRGRALTAWTPARLAEVLFDLDPALAATSGSSITSVADAHPGGSLTLTPSGTVGIDTSGALPVVSIPSGTSQLRTLSGGLAGTAQPHSIYALVQLPNPTAANQYDILGLGSGSNVSNVGLYNTSPLTRWRFYDSAHYSASSAVFNGGRSDAVGKWVLVAKEYDGSAVTYRINGFEGFAYTAMSTVTDAGLGLIARNGASGMVIGAKVARAIWLSGTLGTTYAKGNTRWKLESWFAQLRTQLGGAAFPAFIHYEGDSLTQGLNGFPDNSFENTYPYQCQSLLGSETLSRSTDAATYPEIGGGYNYGVGGNVVADLVSRGPSTTGPDRRFSPFWRNVLVVWIGTNNANKGDNGTGGTIANPAAFAADVYAQIRSYIAARRAAGADVVILINIIARAQDSVGGHLATRDALRALITGSVADGTADYTIDPIAVDSHFADSSYSTYFESDGVHLKTAGNAVVAQMVADVVRPML